MSSPFHAVFGPLLDFLYPPLCLSCRCRRPDGESLFCTACRERVPFLSGSDPALLRTGADLRRDAGIEELAALWMFDGPVRDLIHAIKYGGLQAAGEEAGRWLGEHIERCAGRWLVDILVPVPLHRARLRERGYNQSAAIARGMSRVLGLPLITRAAERARNTSTQTALDRGERLRNVAGAFRIRRPGDVRCARILLVDDVITTGATVGALAGALRLAGSGECAAACLAIAPAAAGETSGLRETRCHPEARLPHGDSGAARKFPRHAEFPRAGVSPPGIRKVAGLQGLPMAGRMISLRPR
jgi:ComF family protein